jgi:hypothetical protein
MFQSAIAKATAHNLPSLLRGERRLVGAIGFEPMTLRLSSACSNQLSYAPTRRGAPETGGADEDRTRDLLLAKQALSQLSYGPSGLRSACLPEKVFLSSTSRW